MSKKDFIALADVVRHFNQVPDAVFTPEYVTQELATFCASRNPRFMRSRWIDYIDGKCGPNGGAVKGKAA